MSLLFIVDLEFMSRVKIQQLSDNSGAAELILALRIGKFFPALSAVITFSFSSVQVYFAGLVVLRRTLYKLLNNFYKFLGRMGKKQKITIVFAIIFSAFTVFAQRNPFFFFLSCLIPRPITFLFLHQKKCMRFSFFRDNLQFLLAPCWGDCVLFPVFESQDELETALVYFTAVTCKGNSIFILQYLQMRRYHLCVVFVLV